MDYLGQVLPEPSASAVAIVIKLSAMLRARDVTIVRTRRMDMLGVPFPSDPDHVRPTTSGNLSDSVAQINY